MAKTLHAFLCLLRAALWSDGSSEELRGISLTESEWRGVYRMANEQSVTALVFDALNFLPPQAMPPQSLLVQWMAEFDAVERINEKMNKALASLITMLKGLGLHPVQLKGQGMAAIYPHPLMRECGDIDLYFPRPGERERAEAHVAALGYDMKHAADGSVYYTWQGFMVEHHPALFDMQSSRARRRLLSSDMAQFVPFRIAGSNVEVDVPVPQTCIVLLCAHILKHALGLGIGLRQFCDFARAVHVWRNDYNHAEVAEIFRETNLTAWSQLLCTFIQRDLHTPAEELPVALTGKAADISTECLWRIILHGGNFGHHASGAKRHNRNAFTHKVYTFFAFLRNTPFAFKYAPREALGIVGGLMRGQHLKATL